MESTVGQRLLEVCDRALDRLTPGPARRAIADIRSALDEPLRVVVAGRVSSGKSTLVNALVADRVAQTAAGECTRLVTWFRYGPAEFVEVHPRQGPPVRLPFGPRKSIPDDLGHPTGEIGHVVVYLRNNLLKGVTIIDTPGLGAVGDEHSGRTETLLAQRQGVQRPGGAATTEARGEAAAAMETARAELGIDHDSSRAVTAAEALVYVMAHVPREDATVHLEQFRSAFRSNVSVLNAVGVLSKFDTMTDDPDPWPVARRVAARHAEALGALMRDFLPVNGLLAETTAAHALTEDDALDLEHLAGGDADERYLLLRSVDLFRASDLAPHVPVPRRERLLGLLGLYGVRVALELIEAGARGAARLVPELAARSGFAALREVIEGAFARRAQYMKAGAALAKLEAISFWRSEPENTAHLARLRRALEPVELDPEMHVLEQMRCMQLIGAGQAAFPPSLTAELVALTDQDIPAGRLGLTSGATLPEMEETARRLASEWNGREVTATNRHKERVARMAKEAYTRLWVDLSEEGHGRSPSA